MAYGPVKDGKVNAVADDANMTRPALDYLLGDVRGDDGGPRHFTQRHCLDRRELVVSAVARLS